MKKKILIFASTIILCLTILMPKAYADEIIYPFNNSYKSGIYKLEKNDNGKYNLMYEFSGKNVQSTIIVLDENYDIVYKNINCNRRCNAGTMTNKNTIIIVGSDEVSFYFTKLT